MKLTPSQHENKVFMEIEEFSALGSAHTRTPPVPGVSLVSMAPKEETATSRLRAGAPVGPTEGPVPTPPAIPAGTAVALVPLPVPPAVLTEGDWGAGGHTLLAGSWRS